jgi:predicted Zn-dependent protease
MIKKIICLFIVLVSILLLSVSAVENYQPLGNLSYWYSDADRIYRWDDARIVVCAEKLNGNAQFYFYNAVDHACSQWTSALGITIYADEEIASAPIMIYGGTAAEISELNIFNDITTQNGATRRSTADGTDLFGIEGIWTRPDNTEIEGYLSYGANIYIVDKSRTSNEYMKTATHELGHALGWSGHSSNPNDVMYRSGSSITQLTQRDINHLAQVY